MICENIIEIVSYGCQWCVKVILLYKLLLFCEGLITQFHVLGSQDNVSEEDGGCSSGRKQ